MKRISVLVIAAMFISACGTVPKSSTQLVKNSSTKQSYCYSKPASEVGGKVEQFLSKCYGPVETVIPIGGALVPMKADFQVINEKLPNGNRYSVRNFVGFGLSANVVSGSSGCETDMQMYAISGFWKKAFVALDKEVNGLNPKCP